MVGWTARHWRFLVLVTIITIGYFLFNENGIPQVLLRKRTIQLEDGSTRSLSESSKLLLKSRGVNFFDITGIFDNKEQIPKKHSVYPATIVNKGLITELVSLIDMQSVHADIATLSSFYSRYYNSKHGLRSSDWLFDRIASKIRTSDFSDRVVCLKFSHSWKQYSVIVTFKGPNYGKPDDKITIFGSHIDSTNLLFPRYILSPGADDSASAVATVLEVISRILSSSLDLKNTIEFHFYSAEEGGLLGSQDIFQDYYQRNVPVMAMINFDQIGYSQSTPLHIGVVEDYTSKSLNDYIKYMITEVCSINFVETKCGYACSDSGSADKFGFPSALVIEDEYTKINRFVHSPLDTIDRLNFDLILEFVKLGIGCVVELGSF